MTAAPPTPRPFGQSADAPNGGRYTELAMWLHWLTAALAFAILPVAWVMTNLPRGSAAAGPLFAFHRSLGLTIWLLIAARILWRLAHPAPMLGPKTPRGLDLAAKASHWVIYLAFFAMPVSGFVLSSASGGRVSFWGLPLPGLPRNTALAKLASGAHETGALVVYVLLSLHVLATAWHVGVRRDGVLQRMIPAQTHADPS